MYLVLYTMTHKIMTTISDEFKKLRDRLGLKWTEALKIGLCILAIEKGEKEFLNPINNWRIEMLYKMATLKNVIPKNV